MGEFLMPSLGADMETGTLIEWQKAPGDTVCRGDIIAVVETQKGAIEIEVFETGVLETQLVDIGRQVPVGTPLAFIRTSDSDTTSVPGTQAVGKSDQDVTVESEVKVESVGIGTKVPPRETAKSHRQWISPAARKLASQLGMDTTLLSGSGPQGAIVLHDVRAYMPLTDLNVINREKITPAVSGPVGTSSDSSSQLADMRRAIAAAMARSKREIPHYYLSHTIDVSMAERWLTDVNADREPTHRILMSALFLKAVAMAAKKYPEFNGHFIEGEFHSQTSVHAGMAINLRGGGLVAPAVHNADELDVNTIMLRMRDLIQRVRQGRFRASELADPTLTVSSLGERGVLSLYGVIYPPQVAIIGFGTPCMRPWITEDGLVQARLLTEVTLAADHRVSDGHRGALLLRHIQKTLENPGDK